MLRPPRPMTNDGDGDHAIPVLLRADLLALGYDDRMIRREVKAGEIARIRRGAYADATAWAGLDEAAQHALRARAVLRQANTELVLSHGTALPEWEAPTWGVDLSEVQATRTDRRAGRREAGVRQHRGLLIPEDIVTRRGVDVTAAPRTLIDLSTVTTTEVALPIWDDFLHRGLTTIEEIEARYLAEGNEHPMEHWANTLNTDLLIRIADGRRESVAETRTWFTCWRQQLPLPEPQVEIRNEHGAVFARVDFAWPEHGVWLEFDGKVKYTKHLRPGEDVTDAVLREKRRESDIARITGWRCIRITWSELEHPERLAALIAAELAKGPRHAPAAS